MAMDNASIRRSFSSGLEWMRSSPANPSLDAFHLASWSDSAD